MQVKEQRATGHFIDDSWQDFSIEKRDKKTFIGTI